MILTTKHKVCSEHFYPADFKPRTPDIVVNGKVVLEGSKQIELLPEAYPRIFPGCPSYKTEKQKVTRKPSNRSAPSAPQEPMVCINY